MALSVHFVDGVEHVHTGWCVLELAHHTEDDEPFDMPGPNDFSAEVGDGNVWLCGWEPFAASRAVRPGRWPWSKRTVTHTVWWRRRRGRPVVPAPVVG